MQTRNLKVKGGLIYHGINDILPSYLEGKDVLHLLVTENTHFHSSLIVKECYTAPIFKQRHKKLASSKIFLSQIILNSFNLCIKFQLWKTTNCFDFSSCLFHWWNHDLNRLEFLGNWNI